MNTFVLIFIILTLLLIAALALKARQWVKTIKQDINQINVALNESHEQTKNSINRATEETVNAICLSALGFQFPVFLGGPSIDAWHARSLLFILQENKPRTILELGSGSSTLLIARTLQLMGVPAERHISVDHESRFLNNTRDLAKQNGLDQFVNFEHCPLEPLAGFDLPWYSRIPELVGNTKLDLVVIDGPPAYAENISRAREPALEVLRPYLNENCVIILDDANRTGEQQIVMNWIKKYPEFHLHHMSEGKGIAILIFNS
jgi:predicted O-methyltransferase YrrM